MGIIGQGRHASVSLSGVHLHFAFCIRILLVNSTARSVLICFYYGCGPGACVGTVYYGLVEQFR